jgi:hypothetical protein
VKKRDQWATGLLVFAGLVSLGLGWHDQASHSNNGVWHLSYGVVILGLASALVIRSRRVG